MAELAELLSVEEDDDRIDPEAIVDGSAIIASCSSLIRTNDLQDVLDDSLVEFSHFTVKEFLLELNENSKAEFRKYRLASDDFAQRQLARMCLTYLSMEDFSSKFPETEVEQLDFNEKYPFHSYAANWIAFRDNGLDERSTELSRRLFCPSKSNNFMCWAQALAAFYGIDEVIQDQLVDTSTLHWACIIADPMICSHLIGLNENVNKSSTIGTALHCAILGPKILTADPITSDRLLGYGGDYVEVISLLLAAKADVNATFTPRNQQDASGSVTMFSLAYDSGTDDDVQLILSALLQAGVVCDKPTLELALAGPAAEYLDEVELKNLQPADAAWFMRKYFEDRKQLAPAIATEIQNNVSKDSRSLEEIKTLLMTAAEYGQDKVVATLLGQHIVDVNEPRLSDGSTLLHLCSRANHCRTVELLLNAGADPLQCDSDQKTAFHSAAQHLDGLTFQALLNVAIDADQYDCNGLTPLHEAAYHGNTVVIAQLHEKLGDSRFRATKDTLDGRSLLMCASQSGSPKLVELVAQLVVQPNIENTSPDGSTLLHYAAEAMSVPVIRLLLAKGLSVNSSKIDMSTPLHIVARAVDAGGCSDKRAIMKVLFDYGANGSARLEDNSTALSLLCKHGKMDSEDDLDALSFLLKRTSEINTVDSDGQTALHLLCARFPRWMGTFETTSDRAYAEAICILLENGADITIRDKHNHSPFQMIIQIWKERKLYQVHVSLFRRVWKLLLEKGGKALAETVDLQGKGLLSSAIEEGDTDLTNALLDIHCDVDKRDRIDDGLDAVEQICLRNGSEKLVLRMLELSKRPEIKRRSHNGVALLHFASHGGSENSVLTLLNHSADINERTTISTRSIDGIVAGATALHVAVWKKQNHIVDLLLSRSTSKIEADEYGWTALHCAAYRGNLDAMVALQQESLPSLARNYYGELQRRSICTLSPLHLAAASGNSQIVSHILDAYPSSDIDQRAAYHFTALHMASRYGHIDTVKLLLKSNAGIDLTNDMGHTPLHLSIIGGHSTTALTLLEHGADARKRTTDGLNLEMIALLNGHQDLADKMSKLEAERIGNRILSIGKCWRSS